MARREGGKWFSRVSQPKDKVAGSFDIKQLRNAGKAN